MINCFVIMPFRPELAYFYRSLKAHIESTFLDVRVQRGDDSVLTVPLLDKIVEHIQEADVVIADCTGRNPNVFYELGIAHAFGKPVILVTSDPLQYTPTDIRAYELVSYADNGPEQFFARMDDALRPLVGNPFAALYQEARDLFERFRTGAKLGVLVPASEVEFEATFVALRRAGLEIPRDPGQARATFLIRRLLGVEPSIDLLVALDRWIEALRPE